MGLTYLWIVKTTDIVANQQEQIMPTAPTRHLLLHFVNN